MIISLIEMLALPNFVHMIVSTIKFKSRNSFFGDVMNRNYDFITFVS